MIVNFAISGLSRESGGTTAAVVRLAEEIDRVAEQLHLYTTGETVATRFDQSVHAFDRSFPTVLAASRDLKRVLSERLEDGVLHGHGLWQLPVHYAARCCRKRGIPYIIAPHGMLEPWALGRSRWKKRVVGWLFQNRDLHDADCLHATAPSEVDSFRAYGLENPIAVVPNGVDLEQFAELDSFEGRLGELYPATRDRPIVLFLSRLHPKKGLLHLVEAWRNVNGNHPEWLLLVVGADDVGHGAEVERKVRDLGLADSVLFTGPMYDEQKLAAFAAADIFVLPSFSEGFSMAVLEALACRLPVLITPGCNFPEVGGHRAGVIVEPNAEGTEAGLRRLMAMMESDRAAMGARGRALVEANYTWDSVAEQMIGVYQWLLGRGMQPECVVT